MSFCEFPCTFVYLCERRRSALSLFIVQRGSRWHSSPFVCLLSRISFEFSSLHRLYPIARRASYRRSRPITSWRFRAIRSPFSLLVMLSRLSPRVNILLLHRLVVEYSVISLYIIPPPNIFGVSLCPNEAVISFAIKKNKNISQNICTYQKITIPLRHLRRLR